MKKIETYLPIFNGFYGTLFEAYGEDYEIDDINQQRTDKGLPEIEFSDCEFNYKEYRERVAEKCTEVIEFELIQILGTKFNFEFQSVISPREYNFTNDSINIEVEIENLDAIKDYLRENQKEFGEYLKDNYTSYDGFISSWSNNPVMWFNMLDKEERLSHVLGSVMNFILLNDGYETNDLYDSLDGVNYITADNYDELISPANEKQSC